jgi:hypothetical protein
MQQINRSTYLVAANEVVTIEIKPTKVGNFATLSIDNATPSVVGPLTFRYPVTGAAGTTHFGMISCFFPPATPDDAKYDVTFSGSAGGTFQGSDIEKHDPTFDRGFELRRL